MSPRPDAGRMPGRLVAQHGEHAIELVHGVAALLLDRLQRAGHERLVGLEHAPGGAGLQHDRGHRVADRVVQVAGQVGAGAEPGGVGPQAHQLVVGRRAEQRAGEDAVDGREAVDDVERQEHEGGGGREARDARQCVRILQPADQRLEHERHGGADHRRRARRTRSATAGTAAAASRATARSRAPSRRRGAAATAVPRRAGARAASRSWRRAGRWRGCDPSPRARGSPSRRRAAAGCRRSRPTGRTRRRGR